MMAQIELYVEGTNLYGPCYDYGIYCKLDQKYIGKAELRNTECYYCYEGQTGVTGKLLLYTPSVPK